MSDGCTWKSLQDLDFTSQFVPKNVENEAYFDICHENSGGKTTGDIQFFSPLPDTPACLQFPLGKRKSMSSTDLSTAGEIASSTDDISNGIGNMRLSPTGRLNHDKSISKENLSKLAKPKKRYNQAYVPMIEAVNKFNTRTPDRFHTKPKNSLFVSKPYLFQSVTSPHSPVLATKKRTRPRVVLSREEMEAIEVEEMKKFKTKANPINPKVLQGPVTQVPVFKKPNTIIKPFRLTECHQTKKSASTESIASKKSFTGSATKLAPFSFDTSIQELVKKKQERNTMLTKPRSVSAPKPFNPHGTEVKPFSFEQRDRLIGEKRKTIFQKVVEDEKKARQFHAKSPPKYVKDRSRMGSMASLRSNNDSDVASKPKSIVKCRPPTVLYQKPFEPKRLEHRKTEVMEFQLSTGRRAKEREDFEQMLKEKDAIIARLKREQEEQREIQEQEEVAKLRKEMEYKAQPVPQFKEFNIVPSNMITIALSPKVLSRGSQNKENRM